MAESYRGLTIRIGGDTTGLQKALKTSTGAIQGADMELRKLGQALKLDPGNVEAFNLQLGALGDKATSTAMKLYQMKEAAEQIRGEKTGRKILDEKTGQEIEQTLGMAAKEVKNVHLNAELAKASFNKVRDELHGLYTTLTGYNEQVAAQASSQFADLGKKLRAAFADVGSEKFEENVIKAIDAIKAKFDDFENVIALPDNFVQLTEQLKKYAREFKSIEDEAQKEIIQQAFAEIAQQITVATGQVVNFENKLTRGEDIKNIADKLVGELDLDRDKVDAFLDQVMDFKDRYKSAMDEVQQANKIASLADLDVEIARAESSVNNLAKAIANMKAPSKLLMEMNDLTEKADAFGKAMTESMSHASAAEKAYEIDPTNIKAAEAAMRGYSDAEADATAKASVLREQMSKFDSSEVEQYAKSTMTATEQLVKASVEHEKATLAVAQYEGAVKGATAMLETLNNTASREIRILDPDSVIKYDDALKALRDKFRDFDEATAEAKESIKANLVATLEELRDKANEAGETQLAGYFADMRVEVEQLSDSYGGLAAAQEHAEETASTLQLAQRRRDYEELQQQLIEVLGSADKAKVAMQQLVAGDFKMDTKWIDDLKGAKSDLESLGSSVAQEFQQATLSITALGDVTDDATQRAKTLIDTFASDMGNTDALRLGIDALKDAFIASNTKAELLRDTISKYESEDIDEVAIATGAVGTNAELAAAAVTAAFKSFDDAKNRVKELETALEKALKSAAGNTGGAANERVAMLTKALESAREEANRLGVAAEESLNRLDMAKATQELVRHREELAKVDAEYEKLVNDTKAIAASLATGSNESFSQRLFGDVNADIANVKASFDAAVERAKVLRTAAAEVGNNTEIASQKARAFDDAVAVGKQYVQDLSNAAKNIMPDGETEEVVKLRQEFGSAKNAVTMLTSEATKLNAKVIELSQQRDMSPKGSERWNELDSEVTQIRARLEEVRQRLQGMGDDTKGAIAIAMWEEYIDKIVAANAELSKLETGKLFGTADSSSGFMQSVNNIMQHVERFGSKVVESADTIDAAFRDMRKTVDGTESQFKTLREEAIRFSQTHFTSADTMLEMEALGGQLGVTIEKLEEFGAVAANLSIATDIGAEDVALQLGQLTNIMSDLNEDTFQNVGDALVRLGNNTATTESKIMGVAERMAAIANVTSMTTPDLLAWSAAIASTGQRSESAATAINNSITGIGQAVAEGGKKLDAFAKIAGMTAEEFKTLWQESSSDALEAFVKGLGSLTDESTEAIAALDSVGISSVRQETALLALSQTIDNLDNSMQLAREGFNGGGDAAREAAQKADGFSGALQILRNNVANLAAQFGDGLVPFIKLASGALELLNNIMGALSPVTKTAIVAITGISTALAVAVPVLQKFSDGWKKLSADMAASDTALAIAPKIGAAMKSLTTLKDALFTVGATMASTMAAGTSGAGMLSTAFAGLGTAIGGAATALGGLILPIAGIAALVAVVDTAVNAYNDWKQEQEEFSSAMRSARGEIDTTKASVEEYAASLESSSETAEQIAESTSSFLQSQSDFVDSVSGTLEKVGKDSALIESYAQTIQELSGHVEGNKAKLKLLTDTVEKYNKLAGSSIQVINDTTGAVSIQADALRELTDEYKRNAEAAAWVDIYQDATTAYVEAQYERQKAEMAAADTREQLTALTRDGIVAFTEEWNKYNELNAQLDESEKKIEKAGEVERERKRDLDAFKKIMGEATEATEESAATSEDYSSALSMAGESLDEFLKLSANQRRTINEVQSAMVAAGDSLTNYGTLNKDQLVEIVNAWDGSVDNIVALVKKLKDAAEDAKESLYDVKKASQEEINEQTRKNQHAYDALKRELDHQYDAKKDKRDKDYDDAKRSYDNEYDLLKRELDHQYDAQKDKYDKDYDAQKDAADKGYDALKDRLDKEYDVQKDAFTKEYNLRKRQLDDIYNAQKEAYDDARNALKDALDDEYDLLKDELDKQYNALKDSLDDAYDAQKDAYDKEYDALKDSLDKKYNAIKKQYAAEKEARKKVLSDEVDDYKDALDDEYDARKSELDAEYKVAQKASQKYLKQFKKGQTEAVSAFKKATDARIAEINREMEAQQALVDAETKRKTDAIDAKIAELRGMTNAENKEERNRERSEKTAELRKAVNDAKSRRTRAEAEKALNDYLREIALEDAQEKREALIEELEAEKEIIETDGEERKEKIDEQYSAEIESFKESREQELAVYQEFLDERYEMEQEAETTRLDAIKTRQQEELDAIKEQNALKVEEMKARNQEELDAIDEQNALKLEKIKEQHDAELAARKEMHEADLERLKEEHDAELEARKELHDSWLEAMKGQHEAELEAVKARNDAELEAKKEANEALVESQKDSDEAVLLQMKYDHENELQEIKDNQSKKLEEIKDTNDLILQKYKDDGERVLQQLKDNHSAELAQMKENHEDILKQKKYDNDDALQAIKDNNELELRNIKEGYDDQLTALKEHNEDIINEMKGNKTNVEAEAQATADAVKGAADDGTDHVEKKVVGNEILLKSKVTETGADIKGVSKDTSEAVKTDTDGVTDHVEKKVVGNEVLLKSKVTETGDDIKGVSKDTSESVKTDVDGVDKALVNEKGTGSIVKNWNEVGTKVPQESDKVNKALTKDSDDENKALTKDSNEYTASLTKNWNDLDSKATEKFGSITKTMSSEGTKITKQFDEDNKKLEKSSETTAKNVPKNMETAMNESKTTIKNADLSGAAKEPLGSLETTFKNADSAQWGYHLIENLASGINTASPLIATAAQTVGNLIKSYIGHSVPEKGVLHEGGKGEVVWGQDLVDNFVEGIESKEQMLARALTGLAEVVEDNFNPELSLGKIDEYLEYSKAAYGAAQLEARARMSDYANDVHDTGHRIEEDTDVRLASILDSLAGAMSMAERMSAEAVERYMTNSKMMQKDAERSIESYVDSVAAAYEAIADITQGVQDRSYLVTQSQQQQPRQAIINVNVTLSDVTIRETADVDRLAQALAQRVDQVTRSRIGR